MAKTADGSKVLTGAAGCLLAVSLVLAGCSDGSDEVVAQPGASGQSQQDSSDTEARALDRSSTNPAWSRFAAADPAAAIMEVEQYGTLEEMTAASSSVVLGSVRRVELGRSFGSDPNTQVRYVTVFVESGEVLAGGQPQLTEDGLIRVEFALGPDATDEESAARAVSELQPLEAGEPTVFFLRHKAEEAANEGRPELADTERGWYRTVNAAGLVTFNEGKADVTMYTSQPDGAPVVAAIEEVDAQAFVSRVAAN